MPITAPSSRHGGRVALALLAGPVVTLAGMAATPWEPESTSASYLETMAAHPTRVQVAALLLIFGYALMGVAWFTVLRLAGGVSPKLRVPAAVLAFCAATILPGMVSVDWLHLAIAQELPRAEGVRVFDAANHLGLFQIARIPAVAGMVLGGLLVVVCAWRAGLVRAWAIAVTVAGFAIVPMLGTAGIIAGAALTVVVFAAIARGTQILPTADRKRPSGRRRAALAGGGSPA